MNQIPPVGPGSCYGVMGVMRTVCVTLPQDILVPFDLNFMGVDNNAEEQFNFEDVVSIVGLEGDRDNLDLGEYQGCWAAPFTLTNANASSDGQWRNGGHSGGIS